MEIAINTLGIIAGGLTTLSQLPQIIKILKTKSADDISYGMYMMLIFGGILWVTYGVIIKAIPVIIANVVMLALVTSVILFKSKYKK